MLKQCGMAKLKYRKYDIVSNLTIHYILWWGIKDNFADIPWQNPNITQVVIN
jgi:hypothetical protein